METMGAFRGVKRIADGTLLFRIDLSGGDLLDFRAGQYVYLEWIAPPLTDEKGDGRNLSIASPPSELPVLSFATRATGSAFKKCLEIATEGAPVRISGPYGSFVLPENLGEHPEKIFVFVAGGIGITPIRSILLSRHPGIHSVRLFLFTINRTAEAAPFYEELRTLARNTPNLQFAPYVTDPSAPGPDGTKKGRPSPQDVLRIVGNDARRAEYFIAGAPQMVGPFQSALIASGVSSEAVHADWFFGYR
jgi:ferredoxin-NADP reductase